MSHIETQNDVFLSLLYLKRYIYVTIRKQTPKNDLFDFKRQYLNITLNNRLLFAAGYCTKRFSITETLKFMVSPIHEL